MVIGEKLYTADEFWVIAQLPENEDKRLALLDGVIVEVPPSSQKNTVTAARIIYFFNAFVIPRNLGYVTGADGGFTLDARNARQPDVAFISKARHARLEGVVFPLAPDLAVEVISPSESGKTTPSSLACRALEINATSGWRALRASSVKPPSAPVT